eukprot:scaffold1955_cov106-Skeletonema_dohrnii-CCMP3373.AAC.5
MPTGTDMNLVNVYGSNELIAGKDVVNNVLSNSNSTCANVTIGCENFTVSEVNIIRLSSDGSASRIDRAHFESAKDVGRVLR